MFNSNSHSFFDLVCRTGVGILFCFFLACGLISTSTYAQEKTYIVLESSTWEQHSIPASGAGSRVRQLSSDALPANAYGSTWALYVFDAASGSYQDPGIDGQIPQGAGFWIFQATGSPVVLELSGNISQSGFQTSDVCFSIHGCTEIPLLSRENQSTYNLLGSALHTDVGVDEIRIRTQAESSACRSGCSWQEAVALQYVADKLWYYDSSENKYIDLALTGVISARQSFWIETLPAMQASNAQILFPAHSGEQDCLSSSGFAGDDGLKLWCWPDLATEINSRTDQAFVDGDKLFTSVHHYPDDTSSFLPVEVVGDELVFTVSPRNPLSTTKPTFPGERSAWNYRSEIRDSPSDVNHPNGTEQWWGFNYTFGDDYIIDDLPWIMWQTHTNESSPSAPVQALEVASTDYGRAGNVRGEIVVANNVYFGSTGSKRLRTLVIPQAGQTLKVVIQLVWGTETTGLLRIWLDDVLVYDERERTSYPEHEKGGYWKAGIYKWRWKIEGNIEISEALGITQLQTSIGSLRVIKNDPDDAAYMTDQYALVDPVQNH